MLDIIQWSYRPTAQKMQGASVTIEARGESLLVREIAGEVVVLDMESNRVHQLNATASFIWRLGTAGATPESIASALTDAFDVERERALEDVQKTMLTLRMLGLLAKHPDEE